MFRLPRVLEFCKGRRLVLKEVGLTGVLESSVEVL